MHSLVPAFRLPIMSNVSLAETELAWSPEGDIGHESSRLTAWKKTKARGIFHERREMFDKLGRILDWNENVAKSPLANPFEASEDDGEDSRTHRYGRRRDEATQGQRYDRREQVGGSREFLISFVAQLLSKRHSSSPTVLQWTASKCNCHPSSTQCIRKWR
jgi:hypothetical protein